MALADKLDSLAGFFAMGMIPSGSQDPYALRRAAAGCANIIFRRGLDIRITEILPYAFELLKKDARALDWAGLEEKGAKVVAFLNQRVENILAEEGVGYDIVNAINASVAASEGNITGLVRRAQALQSYRAQRGFTELLAAMNRIGNILRSADDESAGVEPSLFTDQSEQALFDQIEQREAGAAALLEAGEVEQALALLAELAPYIAKFFEAVMVMDKDPALRRNRQALLRRILSLALQIGDFGKIVE